MAPAWREPTRTKTHDFIDKELGRAVPYGVYDMDNDEGWVSVGDTGDTRPALPSKSIQTLVALRWARRPLPRRAQVCLITADAGGSNGHRVKLWKVELAKLAPERAG